MSNKDMPAFPFEDVNCGYHHTGMTKLEEFAKAAMQGLLSNPVIHDRSNEAISYRAIKQAISILEMLEEYK